MPLTGDQPEPAALIANEVQQHVHLRFGQPAASRVDVSEQHYVESIQLLRRIREGSDRLKALLNELAIGFQQQNLHFAPS